MDRLDALQKDVVNLNPHDPVPYGQTDIGRVRGNNEDALLLFDPTINNSRHRNKKLHKVFAVADGVGGRSDGEIASNSIVRGIQREAIVGNYVGHEGLHVINANISKGASTLVMAQQLENGNDYLIDSIGDSSPLLIDTVKGIVTELTLRDEDGQGNVTQVMGPEGNYTAAFRISNRAMVRLREGQTLILATDGLTTYIDKMKIKPANILTLRKAFVGDNRGFVSEMVRMVNTQGGSDNVTIISIPFDPKYA